MKLLVVDYNQVMSQCRGQRSHRADHFLNTFLNTCLTLPSPCNSGRQATHHNTPPLSLTTSRSVSGAYTFCPLFATPLSIATRPSCILATVSESNICPTRAYNASKRSSNRSDAVAYVKVVVEEATDFPELSIRGVLVFEECLEGGEDKFLSLFDADPLVLWGVDEWVSS